MKMKQLSRNIVYFKSKEFDQKPGPFCMSFRFDNKMIISSIEKTGLINYPYVRRNEKGLLDIITGYRRIMALKALNWEMIPCIEITDYDLADSDLLNLNLYDNLCTRRFNDVERGMILNRLMFHFSKDVIYEHYMNLINISKRKEVDLLVKVEELSEDVKNSIADGIFSMKTLESLINMKTSELNIISKLIADLNLNFNHQSLFIEYINDISIRENMDLQDLLNEDAFTELIMEKTQNIPQKAKRILELLRARRFPIITTTEKAFTKMVSLLDMPKNARIKAPPFFEGQEYTLEVSFKNGKELKHTIDDLSRIEEIEIIKDPWLE
jgi:hypothetical protein